MSSLRVCFGLVSLSLLLLATGCSSATARCTPESCGGCCDENDRCVQGSSDLACGSGGLFCSPCGSSQSCSAGACVPKGNGTCQPLTCAGLHANCGTVPDGCGGGLSCGDCGSGESCGGAGQSNVCGPGTCTAKSCAVMGESCGVLSDGCGAVLDCGSCGGGKTCGGGGVPNRCGDPSSCVRTTCELAGKNCGAVSDGCGGTIDCGGCSAGLSCGGGGVPNVCADACGGCPSGYACANKVCSGGNAENLTLDVRTPAVTSVGGVVRYNGALPHVREAASSCGVLKLTSMDGKHTASLEVNCNNASNVTFSGRVVAGLYRAELSGADTWLVVPKALTPLLNIDLRSSRLDVVLDFNGPAAVRFTGKVLKNSEKPVVHLGNAFCGRVDLDSTAASVRVYLACVTGGDVTFEGWAVAGTYRVDVAGRLDTSNLPDAPQLASAALAISQGMAPLTLNMRGGERIELKGGLRINGQPGAQFPVFKGMALVFKNTVSGESFAATPTPGVSGYSLPVLAGTYDVTVRLNLFASSTPIVRKLATSLSLMASNAMLNFDLPLSVTKVGVSLTLNGAPVQPDPNGRCFGLRLINTVDTDSYDAYCPYSSTSSLAFAVPPGVYKAQIFKAGADDPVPPGFWPAGNVTIGSTAATLNLSVTTPALATVSGVVRHNGLPPVVFNGGTSDCGAVIFTPLSGGEGREVRFSCTDSTGFSINEKLTAGTYKVSVRGDQVGSSLPNTPKQVLASLVVSASTPPQVFDVKTPPAARIAGRVLHNGIAPLVLRTTTRCGLVTLTNANGIDHQMLPLRCASGSHPTFQGVVLSGTYRAAVVGESEDVLLPPSEVVAIEQVALP